MGLGFEGLKGDKGQKGDPGPPGSTAPFVPFQGISEIMGPPGEPGQRGDKVRRKILLVFLHYIITCRILYYILTGVTFRVKWDRKDKKENQES